MIECGFSPYDTVGYESEFELFFEAINLSYKICNQPGVVMRFLSKYEFSPVFSPNSMIAVSGLFGLGHLILTVTSNDLYVGHGSNMKAGKPNF